MRICVSGPDGSAFVPLGRAADFPSGRNEDVGGHLKLGPDRWYYIDGTCEIQLPTGVQLRLRAMKGPEFAALDETVTLGAGQISLRFALKRLDNSRAEDWDRIDTRCHFLTPHAALLEAAAEDIDVVNLLAIPFPMLALDAETYTTTPNLLAFSGQTPALEADGRAVVVNTLNAHPVLGKVALLHSHRPIFPLTFGDDSDDWSICDWCDQCHRKKGLTVWVDAFEPAGGLTGGEGLLAAILGKIGAIEVTSEPRKVPLVPWVYRLWDACLLVPLVGASGKDSNRIALGRTRTYARRAGETWVEAIRAGRTVASEGPLLVLEQNGDRFRAALRSASSAGRVEIVANGRVIAAGEGEVEAGASDPGWVAARCHAASGGFAHTSPVAVGAGARKEEARAALVKLAEETREWVETLGRFANPKRKAALLARCDEAVAKLGERA